MYAPIRQVRHGYFPVRLSRERSGRNYKGRQIGSTTANDERRLACGLIMQYSYGGLYSFFCIAYSEAMSLMKSSRNNWQKSLIMGGCTLVASGLFWSLPMRWASTTMCHGIMANLAVGDVDDVFSSARNYGISNRHTVKCVTDCVV